MPGGTLDDDDPPRPGPRAIEPAAELRQLDTPVQQGLHHARRYAVIHARASAEILVVAPTMRCALVPAATIRYHLDRRGDDHDARRR